MRIKCRKELRIILTLISVINIILLVINYIIAKNDYIQYGVGIGYYGFMAIIIFVLQIVNIMLLYRVKKISDKKAFIKNIINSIIIIIITFFLPLTVTVTRETIQPDESSAVYKVFGEEVIIETDIYKNIYTLKIFEDTINTYEVAY